MAIPPALPQLLEQIFLNFPFMIFFAGILGQINLHGETLIKKISFLTWYLDIIT